MKRTLLSVAIVAMAFGLSMTAAQATTIVTIQPTGAPPSFPVGSLDWTVANSIAVADPGQNLNTPFVGQQLTVFAMASLGNFLDGNFNTIQNTGLGTAYEWTFVSQFREQITAIGTATGTVTTAVVADPLNTFQIYYDTSIDSNNLTGKGFEDGVNILTATGGDGGGTFTANLNPDGSVKTAILDGAGTNNYVGYTTETGQGSTTITGTVSTFDPAFFTSLVTGQLIDLNFTTQQALNYLQTNPASCFFNPTTHTFFSGAGNGITGGCGRAGDGGTIGLQNGVPGTPGPNQIFQTDASTSFNVTSVPEPGTLALLGIALLGIVGLRRNRNM